MTTGKNPISGAKATGQPVLFPRGGGGRPPEKSDGWLGSRLVPNLRVTGRMRWWRLYRNQSGFSLGELLMVVAIIGIVSVLATPAFISYSQAARLKGGAQELVTILNQARQVAITRNTSTCVLQSTNKVRVAVGSCAGTIWTGAGTDGNGWFTLTEDVRVSAATANVEFTRLGTASTAGTYTVLNPANNRTLHVIVALSGRITMGP